MHKGMLERHSTGKSIEPMTGSTQKYKKHGHFVSRIDHKCTCQAVYAALQYDDTPAQHRQTSRQLSSKHTLHHSGYQHSSRCSRNTLLLQLLLLRCRGQHLAQGPTATAATAVAASLHSPLPLIAAECCARAGGVAIGCGHPKVLQQLTGAEALTRINLQHSTAQ
jgi:hypothetical protein